MLSLGAAYPRRPYTPSFSFSGRPGAAPGTQPFSRSGSRIARSLASQDANTGPDLKSVDLLGNPAFDNAPAANLSVHLLNGIDCGTSAYNRIGNRVNAHSIRVRWSVVLTDAVTTATTIRVALIWDRHPNGVLPAFNEIFADTSHLGAVSSGTSTFPNVANLDRFKILRDQFHRLRLRAAVQDVSMPSETIEGDWYVKLAPLVQTFVQDGEDSTIASIKSGAVYLVAFNPTHAFAAAALSCSFCARYNFSD